MADKTMKALMAGNSAGESDVSVTGVHASSMDCDDTFLVLQRSYIYFAQDFP